MAFGSVPTLGLQPSPSWHEHTVAHDKREYRSNRDCHGEYNLRRSSYLPWYREIVLPDCKKDSIGHVAPRRVLGADITDSPGAEIGDRHQGRCGLGCLPVARSTGDDRVSLCGYSQRSTDQRPEVALRSPTAVIGDLTPTCWIKLTGRFRNALCRRLVSAPRVWAVWNPHQRSHTCKTSCFNDVWGVWVIWGSKSNIGTRISGI
jgi:hypothetical protein